MVHTTKILYSATQRLPPDSNFEKTFARRYYRAARRDKENGSRWLKPPSDGGLKTYERWANYMSWISRARREFLENHQGDIWKRHQQCGFNLAIDGSENHKLHFRDGNCDYEYWNILYLCKAKTILICQRFSLWLGGKTKALPNAKSSQMKKTLKTKITKSKNLQFLWNQGSGRFLPVVRKPRSQGCGFQKNLRASDVRKSLPVHLQGDHDINRKRRK